jgi:hypothetical protein
MVAEMRNVPGEGETDEESRKDGQKLVEGHTSALAEDVIAPGFPQGPAKQIRDGKIASVQNFGTGLRTMTVYSCAEEV